MRNEKMLMQLLINVNVWTKEWPMMFSDHITMFTVVQIRLHLPWEFPENIFGTHKFSDFWCVWPACFCAHFHRISHFSMTQVDSMKTQTFTYKCNIYLHILASVFLLWCTSGTFIIVQCQCFNATPPISKHTNSNRLPFWELFGLAAIQT